jgi:hypothetical protein
VPATPRRGVPKKGALPANPRVVIPTLEDYIDVSALGRGLPAAPGVIDRESKVSEWPMYANGPDPNAPPVIAADGIGDCCCAGIAHFLAAATAYSGKHPGGVMFTDKAVIDMYSAISGYQLGNPSTDVGCQLQSVTEYMVTTGLADTAGKVHKFAGYFAIGDYTNLALLKQVANTFGGVYLGVYVSDETSNQYLNGQPWTLARPAANVGPYGIDHCVVLQYSAFDVVGVADDQTVITWGIEQKINQAWAVTYIGQALGLITEDWVAANGTTVNGQSLAQLIADSKDVKG